MRIWSMQTLVFLLILLISLPAFAISFNSQLLSSGHEDPQAVIAADLDRDGAKDIVTACWSEREMYWWQGRGTGSFTQKLMNRNVTGAVDLGWSDFNGDGLMDIAIARDNLISGSIGLMVNDGSGRFNSRSVGKNFDGASDLVVSDFDGDGDKDIIACAKRANEVKWWENRGNLIFQEHLVYDKLEGVSSITVADFNADKKIDIIAGSAKTGQIVLLKQKDKDTFTASTVLEGYVGLSSMDAGFLNKGWSYDVVICNDQSGKDAFVILWNDGGGNFTKATLSSEYCHAVDVVLADMDGDRDKDIVAGTFYKGVRWWENIGDNTGKFNSHFVDANFECDGAVYVSDLDNDSDMDVLAASTQDGRFVIYYSSHNPERGVETKIEIVQEPALTNREQSTEDIADVLNPLKKLEKAKPVVATADISKMSHGRKTITSTTRARYIKMVKNLLTHMDYYHGNVDSLMNADTHQSIRKFQRDHRIGIDGILGPQTNSALMNRIMENDSLAPLIHVDKEIASKYDFDKIFKKKNNGTNGETINNWIIRVYNDAVSVLNNEETVSTISIPENNLSPTGLPVLTIVELSPAVMDLNPETVELYSDGEFVGSAYVEYKNPLVFIVGWEAVDAYHIGGCERSGQFGISVKNSYDESISVVVNEGNLDYSSTDIAACKLNLNDIPHQLGIRRLYSTDPEYLKANVAVARGGQAQITLKSISGKELFKGEMQYKPGYHEFRIKRSDLSDSKYSGMAFLTVKMFGNTRSERMLIQN